MTKGSHGAYIFLAHAIPLGARPTHLELWICSAGWRSSKRGEGLGQRELFRMPRLKLNARFPPAAAFVTALVCVL
jgi:hypothetical protein